MYTVDITYYNVVPSTYLLFSIRYVYTELIYLYTFIKD